MVYLNGLAAVKTPDLQIEQWLFELENDIIARKVRDETDPGYATYFAAKLEYELGKPPNLGYVRALLQRALSKPLITRH